MGNPAALSANTLALDTITSYLIKKFGNKLSLQKTFLFDLCPIASLQGVKLMGKGSGYGKVILFGEHFVVHGVPGIVSAIDSTTDAEVKKAAKESTFEMNAKPRRVTAKKNGSSNSSQSRTCSKPWASTPKSHWTFG